MRHGMKHRKLNMDTNARRALFSNLTAAVLTHEQIKVTLPRAKELRTFVDNMITLGKKGLLSNRRQALAFLRDNEVVSKLFSTLAERYKDRNGGYTRVLVTSMPKALKTLHALLLKKRLLLKLKRLMPKLNSF